MDAFICSCTVLAAFLQPGRVGRVVVRLRLSLPWPRADDTWWPPSVPLLRSLQSRDAPRGSLSMQTRSFPEGNGAGDLCREASLRLQPCLLTL